MGGLSQTERAELDEMIDVADKMAARIETLEAILDVESPDWRSKDEARSSGPAASKSQKREES